MDIKIDRTFSEQMLNLGVDEGVGGYGEHRLQMSGEKAVRLDKISSDVSFQGFTEATKIRRGKEGLRAASSDTLAVLAGGGKFDIKGLLTALKTGHEYTARLIALGQMDASAMENSLWAYAEAVQTLSNTDLSAVFQAFSSVGMTLLTNALEREVELYAEDARDAKEARARLFDIQALVMRELGNRVANSEIDSAIAALPKTEEEEAAREAKLGEKRAQMEELKAQMDGLSESFTREMRPCFEKQAFLETKKVAVAAKEHAYNEAKAVFTAQTEAYAAAVSANLEAQNRCEAGDTATRARLVQELADAKAQYQVQKDVIVRVAEEVQQSQAELAALKEEIASYDPTVKAFDEWMGELRPKLNALQHEVEMLSATAESLEASRPVSLTEQYCEEGVFAREYENDVSATTLLTLTEVEAASSTRRENQNAAVTEDIVNHGVSATPHELGEILRASPITINYKSSCFLHNMNILEHSNQRMPNRYDFTPPTSSYITLRDTVEKNFFPELEGHEIRPEERPAYGALNTIHDFSGPMGAHEYGKSVIVLKPEVSKRATFSLDDSFYGMPMRVTPERRELFYKLLPSTRLSAACVAALLDPASEAHASCEAYLDRLSKVENLTSKHFHYYIPHVHNDQHAELTHEQRDYMEALCIKVFGCPDVTREHVATYNNLESLLPGLDMTGSLLAEALERKRNGEDSSSLVLGAYMEAQIHGPIIPERDIAEIRVDLDDLLTISDTDEQKKVILETVHARMVAFRERSGANIVYFSSDEDLSPLMNEEMRKDFIVYDGSDEGEYMTELQQAGLQYYAEHHQPEIEAELNTIKADFEGNIRKRLRFLGIDTFFPAEGDLVPPGSALHQKLMAKLSESYHQVMNDGAPLGSSTPKHVADSIFTQAVDETLGAKGMLLRKLHELNLTPAQHDSIRTWVVQSTVTREKEFDLAIHAAKIQERAMIQITSAQPRLSDEEVLAIFAKTAEETRPLVVEFLKESGKTEVGPDDTLTYYNRGIFLGLDLFQNAAEPASVETLQSLFERLNTQSLRTLRAQMDRVVDEIETCPDIRAPLHPGMILLKTVSFLLKFHSQNLAKALGKNDSKPTFDLPNSLISAASRKALRSFTDDAVKGTDELGLKQLFGDRSDDETPIMDLFERISAPRATFPSALHPELLPKTHEERRAFLIKHLDTYLEHERTFDRRIAVHGRGHITRAYVFASAMCSILEEHGLLVDRNAVLCGITGHDSGREGNGSDRWETQSAEKTVEMMRGDYGADTLGAEYEQGIQAIIADRENNSSVEGMILQGADSLDIGRTVTFDLSLMKFLGPVAGDSLSYELKTIREKLGQEASLLQRLTNAYCAQKEHLNELDEKKASDNEVESLHAQQDYDRTMELVEATFRTEREISSEQYVKNMEMTIRANTQLFPILSKYYK